MKNLVRIVISSAQKELLLNPCYGYTQNMRVSPGQSLTDQPEGVVREKDSSALLLSAPLPFLSLSGKDFLLPVNADTGSYGGGPWSS